MLVIPVSSELYTTFNGLAQTKRMVFVTGLPGVGKSLLIQQLAFLAAQAGRTIHTMQWDVSRGAFETPEILAQYPEVDGVTAPIIRKAVGTWARTAVVDWNRDYPNDEHILIGEVPIIGNRLSELIEPYDDPSEPLLSAESTEFVVPVPSADVRAVIEQAREKTIADPQHEKEKMDAAPNVLRAMWQDVNELGQQIKLADAHADSPYNPTIYGGVYDALLEHRHRQLILIDQDLRPQGSVYESDVEINVLAAEPATVNQIISDLESTYTAAELEASVANWHAPLNLH